jgi:hypothetical protein
MPCAFEIVYPSPTDPLFRWSPSDWDVLTGSRIPEDDGMLVGVAGDGRTMFVYSIRQKIDGYEYAFGKLSATDRALFRVFRRAVRGDVFYLHDATTDPNYRAVTFAPDGFERTWTYDGDCTFSVTLKFRDAVSSTSSLPPELNDTEGPSPEPDTSPAPEDPGTLAYGFDDTETIEEAGSLAESASLRWWVSSGGRLIVATGVGKTMHGEAASGDTWHDAYLASNPTDTDDGTHPQNIFRLVTQETALNFRQRLYFRMDEYNISDSPNRNASNGLLLFNRYVDHDHLYYVGVRVDGKGIIKRKAGPVSTGYTTLATVNALFPGTYHIDTNPNLIPIGQWIGIEAELSEESGGVRIIFRTDLTNSGIWTVQASVLDTAAAAILTAGHGGARTDFADVSFDDHTLEVL